MLLTFFRNSSFAFFILFFVINVHAATPSHVKWQDTQISSNKKIAINFQNANLLDAIRELAKFINVNVIISQKIHGIVNLHLNNANPNKALTLLLSMHSLAMWQIDGVWFIAPRDELIKQKQEELKWRDIVKDSVP